MSQKMKKRLLLSFICAVILFIFVISNDGDFSQIILPLMISRNERDISCYIKTSDINGLQEFDASKGIVNFKYCIVFVIIVIHLFFFFVIFRH